MTLERISRDLALERIRHHIREHGPKMLEVSLMDALGLVCAQDLFAEHSTPAEPRSTVDGYALASQATRNAKRKPSTYIADEKRDLYVQL